MINQQEYEKLKRAKADGYEWIARDWFVDNGGNLFAYPEKPTKDYGKKCWLYGGWVHSIDNNLFQFIQWENKYPYSIAELIEEYEEESEQTGRKQLDERHYI